jgi:CelD/BcsL family acetyltransferase involved in cellulose biosynthesis
MTARDRPRPIPFLEREFVEPYVDVVSEARRDDVVAVTHGRGCAHLEVRSIGSLRVAELLGRGFADYMDLSYDSSREAEELIVRLVSDARWDALVLRNLVESSPTFGIASKCAAKGRWLHHRVPIDIAPYLEISGTWRDFYTERRSRKARHNLERAARRLDGMGGLDFYHPRELNAIMDALEHAFSLCNAHPRGIVSEATFSSSIGRRFFRELSERLTARGALDLALLRVGEEPLAFAYGLLQGDIYYYYQARGIVNGPAARFSPGSVLLVHLLQQAFDRGYGRFDFMLGAEPYKDNWASSHETVSTVILASRGPRSRLAWVGAVLTREFRQRARRSPALRHLAEEIAGWGASLAQRK